MPMCRRSILRIACLGLAGTLLCAAAPTDLSAAIAPEYERVRQFSFVVSAANEAAEMLSPYGPIDRIERADDGIFRIWADRCFVPVTLESVAASKTPPEPGTPINYRSALGDVHCP